jgi:glycosyltransferase involved in cell wall biosynthesis
MRILLAHNSLYFPSHGGGDKSNRLLMRELASRGHSVRVVARVESFGTLADRQLCSDLTARGVTPQRDGNTGIRMELDGVDVRVLTVSPHLRAFFAAQLAEFDPDVILTSTDDPAQLLLEVALGAPRARVVYLVRAMIATPFGPASSMPSVAKTAALRRVDGMVAVSESVAAYVREYAGTECVHVPISLLDPGPCPRLGSFQNRFALLVNPCAAKGLPVFLALAQRFPSIQFAAVPSWGTTPDDLANLRRHANITVLEPSDDFDSILRETKVALVPSLWAEARSRIILEAMSRGIPVMASDVGGLKEAKLGVEYLLPVNPVLRYRPVVNELMVPVAEVPPQDISPWAGALERLWTDRGHYEDVADRSRGAALRYVRDLHAGPFEAYLEQVIAAPQRSRAVESGASRELTPAQRKLLAARLKRRAMEGTANVDS